VKADLVKDPELLQSIQEKALARKQAAEEKAVAKAATAATASKKPRSAAAKARAVRAARKLVAENQSELEWSRERCGDEKLSKVIGEATRARGNYNNRRSIFRLGDCLTHQCRKLPVELD